MTTDDYFDAHAAGELAAYRDVLALFNDMSEDATVAELQAAVIKKAIDTAIRAAVVGRTDAA